VGAVQPMPHFDPRLYGRLSDTGVALCNTDHPLFKVTLCCTPHAGGASDFAVLLSMCHNLGDGHTFYTLYAGLGMEAVPPFPLVMSIRPPCPPGTEGVSR
jgi:hypothetical protein